MDPIWALKHMVPSGRKLEQKTISLPLVATNVAFANKIRSIIHKRDVENLRLVCKETIW